MHDRRHSLNKTAEICHSKLNGELDISPVSHGEKQGYERPKKGAGKGTAEGPNWRAAMEKGKQWHRLERPKDCTGGVLLLLA
jgi:hypothetical protein